MARRKQQQETDLFLKLGMVGGALWLVGELSGSLPEGTGDALILTIMCAVGTVAVWFVVQVLSRVNARKSLFEKTRLATERQIKSLTRRRAQLVQKDAYGKLQRDKWEKELSYFVAHHVEPILTAGECRALARHPEIARHIIDSQVQAAMLDQPPYMAFSDDMTPAEFETFCAEALNQAGWDARVTLQSRDQGVDVIAEKNQVRVSYSASFTLAQLVTSRSRRLQRQGHTNKLTMDLSSRTTDTLQPPSNLQRQMVFYCSTIVTFKILNILSEETAKI